VTVDDLVVFGGRAVEVLSRLGVFIALFSLAAKWQEKPQLLVKLDSDPQARYSEGADNEGPFRFVHVVVQNPPIPRVFKFLTSRQPARRVRLKLQYFAVGGTHPKFTFDARWKRASCAICSAISECAQPSASSAPMAPSGCPSDRLHKSGLKTWTVRLASHERRRSI
jgi:hypothetical protein